MSIEGALAVHRFGLGARNDEIAQASASPKNWLMSQLDGPADQPASFGGSTLMTSGKLVAEARTYSLQMKQLREARSGGNDDQQVKAIGKSRAEIFIDEMAARFQLGFATERPFAERLVWFWTNHFGVSASNGQAAIFLGAFEREVIRPNINGRFETMVQAAMRHPAMLVYLNNNQSIGPDSPVGRHNGKGLNENLGRELMELFTLGVDGGYTQADVIAMAKLLTGYALEKDGEGDDGFRFYPARHEPGRFTLRGKTYPEGEEGARAAISDLAADPATARHIARQFAQAFLSDAPSETQVMRLETAFRTSGGSLRALSEAAISDPAAFTPGLAKMRSPVEYVTASYRLLDLPVTGALPDAFAKQVHVAMASARLMGEFPMSAPSPKGWSLESSAWAGPDAVFNRIEWARQVANRAPASVDVRALAARGLGPLLGDTTSTQLGHAASRQEAVALLIASPEFQRR